MFALVLFNTPVVAHKCLKSFELIISYGQELTLPTILI